MIVRHDHLYLYFVLRNERPEGIPLEVRQLACTSVCASPGLLAGAVSRWWCWPPLLHSVSASTYHCLARDPPALAFPQLTDDGQKYITTYSSSNVLGKLQNIRCLTPYFECRQCSRLPDYDVSRLLSRVTSKPRGVTGVDPWNWPSPSLNNPSTEQVISARRASFLLVSRSAGGRPPNISTFQTQTVKLQTPELLSLPKKTWPALQSAIRCGSIWS